MRRYDVEVALRPLWGGGEPCRVRAVGGQVQRWRYDDATGVLALRLVTRDGRLDVRRCGA